MRSLHPVIAAVSAILAATLSLPARTQGVQIDNRIIPESSLQYPGDIGVRAHTHLQILAWPQRGPGFDGGMGPGGGLTPAQLRAAYSLPATGGSQIIAIVDAYDDPNALADFNKFSTQFGLPTEPSANPTASTNKVFQVLYGSGSKPATNLGGGWELEEALDIEWAHAMAPNAKIVLVEAADSTFANLLAAEDVATGYTDGNGRKVREVSNSWGGSEFSGESGYDSHFVSSNVVYFVSAGDSGAPADYPSVCPYVVSAGGTTVSTNSSGAFTGEAGWSLSSGSGGGGGPSVYEARPSYQNGIAGVVGSWRGTPDLSFDANPNTGVSIYDSFPYFGSSYGWVVIGGTSVSSPSLAGIANLAATASGSFPAGSQALLTTIYTNLGSASFRDITVGNNGYATKVGWDYVTGVGSCVGLGGLQGASSVNNAPSISSLNPNSATAGGTAFTLFVNGSNFASGSTVTWNGSTLTTSFVSSTQVTASVSASAIVSAGTASVMVANPGGSASNVATLNINTAGNSVPVLTSITPNVITHGNREIGIICTGSQFVSTSQVWWTFNGVSTLLYSYATPPTKIVAAIPSALLTIAGTATITVINPGPGGGASASLTFTIR